MIRALLLFMAIFTTNIAIAQITITASDMPVSGDTLRMSVASPLDTSIHITDSGASHTWNYSGLVPVAQRVDTYKTALSVSLTYLLISINAYGYKVADTFPGGSFLPVSITNPYTFFEKQSSNTRYAAVAFAAQIAGIATPFNYSKDDIWYYFPLNYGRTDSSNYALNIGLGASLSLKESGYRKTHVDGWGTITTPFYTTPVNCIRVRSEIHEIDSINIGFPIGFPRNTVEYKWLVNGDHYPALWVTTSLLGATETITSVRYRDAARNLTTGVLNEQPVGATEIRATPNPSSNGIITLDIPPSWKGYTVEVFDMQARLIATTTNQNAVNLQNLPAGNYIARVTCGSNFSYVKLVKE